MKTYFLLISLIISISACTNGFRPNKISSSPPQKECLSSSIVKSKVLGPFSTTSEKVQLDLSNADALNSGTELTVLIDEECALKTNSVWPGFKSRLRLPHAIGKTTPFKVQLIKSITAEELKNTADQYECVRGISLNHQMELFQTTIESLPNDPLVTEQFHLTAMRASEGFDIFFNPITGINEPVTIAIIDTGLQMNHEDIVEHIWVNDLEIPDNGIDDDENGYVDDTNGYNFADNIPDTNHQTGTNPFGSGHGTPVTGLAAAIGGNGLGVTGIMQSNVRVMPLVVFDRNGALSSIYVEEAIRYAVDNGAKVLNLSLGTYRKIATMGDAIAYAINNGAVVVSAAGNAGSELTDSYWVSPGSYGRQYEGAITVGSTKAKSGGKCSESNFSTSFVEIGTPGCDGIFTLQSGGSGYGAFGGTSSASPNTAGSAALVMAFIKSRTDEYPTPRTVEQILRSTARIEPNLVNYFSESKHIDLSLLAEELDRLYPFKTDSDPCQ
jgi:hypothetical protein